MAIHAPLNAQALSNVGVSDSRARVASAAGTTSATLSRISKLSTMSSRWCESQAIQNEKKQKEWQQQQQQ